MRKDNEEIARVAATHKDRYDLLTENGLRSAALKSSVFYNNPAFEHPSTGDFVLCKADSGLICAVFKRKSKFNRPDSDANKGVQTIAVNFDYVFIVTSLNKDFNLNRIDRYLSAAWDSGGTPVIVLTKTDLCPDYASLKSQVEERAVGVRIIAASAITGEGIDELAEFFKSGITSVLLGSSGVGKSSLVNAVAGREIMKVNDIRDSDDEGRHTTTLRQLIQLDNGAMIIDTPGMREFGLWDSESGVYSVFNDIDELAQNCRFPNCKHKSEPGCAVREALKKGVITADRLKNYYLLKREAAFTDRKEQLKKRHETRLEKKKSARGLQAEKRQIKNHLRRI